MMRDVIAKAALLSIAFLPGCTYYMPAGVSSANVGGPYEVPVKVTMGESSASYFLFFGPFGDDSIGAAIRDAQTKAKSDSMTNIVVDRKLFCFPVCWFSLYTSVHTMVYGTLVKYKFERAEEVESKAPISLLHCNDLSARNCYSEMFAAYKLNPTIAAAAYGSLKANMRSAIEQYILEEMGRASKISWKFTVSEDLGIQEREFLIWYIKTYTDYKPVTE